MTLRHIVCFFCCLTFSACTSFSQSNSPNELRSAARALTVGDLLGVAERAGEGDTASQLLMGLSLQLIAERMHYDAEGRKESSRLSAHWLRQAAEKGIAPAQYFLAETDWKAAENCDEVSGLLNKAISQDYLPAMTALGRLYMEGGCRFKPDYALALQWFRKASSAGDAEADYWIGVSYEEGRGVKPDETEATRWFLRGAQMGDPSSQGSAGINLADGNGTGKNVTEAVEWFRKSAEQGDVGGACNLALHYIRGEGVGKDYVLALMWGLIADHNATDIGCLSEIDTRDLLQMTAAQKSDAT